MILVKSISYASISLSCSVKKKKNSNHESDFLFIHFKNAKKPETKETQKYASTNFTLADNL